MQALDQWAPTLSQKARIAEWLRVTTGANIESTYIHHQFWKRGAARYVEVSLWHVYSLHIIPAWLLYEGGE